MNNTKTTTTTTSSTNTSTVSLNMAGTIPIEVSLSQRKQAEQVVSLTDRAKKYLLDVAGDGYVTLGVKGGGCSGLTYVWGQTDTTKHDHIQWSDPVDEILLLDPKSEMYVKGSVIDYIEKLGGSYLSISNPMKTAGCGCGSSFSV